MKHILNGKDFKELEFDLDENKGINFQLNGSGVVHMERKLPFMLVFRPNDYNERDLVIENIVRNEASYFICVEKHFAEYRTLLKKVVKKMSDEFGAFLLLEIWPDTKASVAQPNTAGFELYGPANLLPNILSPIKEYIDNMKLAGLIPVVSTRESDTRCPEKYQALLDKKILKQYECLLMGLSVEPFYMDPDSRLTYPLLERLLYSEFSKAFRKSLFDFVKVQAGHNFSGFQSLAKRELKPEVWQIDEQLVNINDQINFLMLVSPVNGNQAWKEFRKSRYRKLAVFHYRMMPEDPELLKRKLYNIRIEDIDDPTLGFLFREKRVEVDKMLSMLTDRESSDFLYGSLQVFGAVSHRLLSVAKEILAEYPLDEDDKNGKNGYYNARQFAKLASREIKYLQKQWPDIENKVEVKDTIDNMMVNKGILNIPAKLRIAKCRAMAMVQHEIGTHVVTYYNGKNQPLKLLCSGIPGYEELQEGIAVLAEYLSGSLSKKRMKVLAARVIAVDSMINRNSFIQTFELLADKYQFKAKDAFFITTRVYRGGGLTKDAIYLRGLLRLVKYLKDENPLEPLLIGKIKQNYIPVINELISRKILNPLSIKPRYLTDELSLKRLSEIKNAEKVTDLINAEI